jgi:hypothetical protein
MSCACTHIVCVCYCIVFYKRPCIALTEAGDKYLETACGAIAAATDNASMYTVIFISPVPPGP